MNEFCVLSIISLHFLMKPISPTFYAHLFLKSHAHNCSVL
jgi:hypothetical protein